MNSIFLNIIFLFLGIAIPTIRKKIRNRQFIHLLDEIHVKLVCITDKTRRINGILLLLSQTIKIGAFLLFLIFTYIFWRLSNSPYNTYVDLIISSPTSFLLGIFWGQLILLSQILTINSKRIKKTIKKLTTKFSKELGKERYQQLTYIYKELDKKIYRYTWTEPKTDEQELIKLINDYTKLDYSYEDSLT